MAEFLRSKCLDVLFDRLLSSDLLKFAQEKQQTKKTVKAWLDDLRDLAYDMEDLLDEFTSEALHESKLMAGQASTSMVRNLNPSWFTALTPSDVTFKISLGLKITEINTRFNDLVTQKDQLNLKENSSPRPNKRRERPPSTSLVTEDHIYGREEVAKDVLQLLVSGKLNDALKKVPNVIPILGMGGIGKTTLAQLVYNDKEVESFFNLKAWACVSEDLDVATVTKTILQSMSKELDCADKDLNWLQVELKQKLLGKRFLVILDDVWNENYNEWTRLRAPFEVGAPGSSIIVTTRNHRVSSLMRNKGVEPFQLELLSNEACLSIFTQHALDARDFSAHPDLKDIGEELVRRYEDRNEWEKVLKNKIWDIPVEANGIPSSLLRCFAYCSILPKNYEFEEKDVVLLWMAEGLIQPRQDEEEMEDLGKQYFRNLLSRSFFQKSRNINESRFSVAGDTCFRIEDRKARHSSYLGGRYDVTKKFEVFSKHTSLRTFLPLMLPYPGYCYLAHHVPFELVPKLRCLRLSDSIGDLKHLRLLPESIISLYNLQTFLLKKCTRLKKLPSKFQNLVNLRHLNIENAGSLEGMPMQIGKLTCLQTLSNLVLGKDNCSGIKELGHLKHLRGRLCIQRLENMIEARDAKDAELIKKTKISALWLEWSGHIDDSKDTTSELEELCITNYGENCYKCTSLPPLGKYLPSLKNLWIEDMEEWEHWSPCEEFPNLRELCLRKCPKLLGKLPNNLPLLNKVEIIDCAQLVVSISCFPDKCKFNIENSRGVVCGSKGRAKSLLLTNNEPTSSTLQAFCNNTCYNTILHRFSQEYANTLIFPSTEFNRSLSPISDMEGLAELKELYIRNCEELTNLWSDNMGSLPHHPFLRFLHISNFDQEHLQLRIEYITIWNCYALESLPKALMYNNTCLEYIEIKQCDSLTHFARSHLPPTLKRLQILDCKSMRNLVEDDDNDTNNNSTCSSGITSLLEELEVRYCPSLESLTSSGELPATLRVLRIYYCPKLESVAKSFHHNSFLTDITISNCENLQLLNGIYNLTSLQRLEIRYWYCPSILSFPKEGFPTNLTTLEINDIKITQALFDWGLDKFTYLNRLEIGGCQNLLSFPEMTLPASLTSLRISKFSNLECLSSEGLRKLTSLKDLSIFDCQKLTCFPEDGLPPSLLELNITYCQKLMSLPKNGLPPSLQKLEILVCPLLEERCKKDQRGEWRKIADIPCVRINNKNIYEIETEE
ncbi:hypothetical protein I3843_16G088700 [Carya illinoinensis]|nr:hypothetical protein I3843_16G088700 [Carya illinoinensis]KAG7942204.1 hypothetical protein I3843_16G088700 [Carya illinoinensis]